MSEYQANLALLRSVQDEQIALALRALRARPETVEQRIARLNAPKPSLFARIAKFFN